MGIEDFKRWHWIAISVFVGAILIYTRLYTIDGKRIAPGDEVNYNRTISPSEFISFLQRPKTENGFAWMQNVVIYPPITIEADGGKATTMKSYVRGENLEI